MDGSSWAGAEYLSGPIAYIGTNIKDDCTRLYELLNHPGFAGAGNREVGRGGGDTHFDIDRFDSDSGSIRFKAISRQVVTGVKQGPLSSRHARMR